jgi:hypothetical protein
MPSVILPNVVLPLIYTGKNVEHFNAMKIFRLIFFNIKTPAKLYVVKDTSKIPPKEDIRMNVTDCFVQIEPCYPNI